MIAALIYVGCSVLFLTLLTLVYAIEDKKGQRIFLVGFRATLDKVFLFIKRKFSAVGTYFSNSLMRLLLHYGAHSILKRILNALRRLEARVEDLVRHNRKVARDIHAAKTRNHLDEIADHKEDVALSEKEKEKMRRH